MLLCIRIFSENQKVTSDFIADSTGVNPVIIRRLLISLKSSGMIEVAAGTGGAKLCKDPADITLLDIYRSTEPERKPLFGFHEKPNENCPVGRNIHSVLDSRLSVAQQAFEKNLQSVTLADLLMDLTSILDKSDG